MPLVDRGNIFAYGWRPMTILMIEGDYTSSAIGLNKGITSIKSSLNFEILYVKAPDFSLMTVIISY
jgi:hypothetical protein